MKLTIDFETRSRVDLRKTNPWVYAEDESTDVICCAVKEDNYPAGIWLPDFINVPFASVMPYAEQLNLVFSGELQRAIAEADTIEAHNAEFEVALWHHVLHKRYGWPDLPVEKMRCTAARAATQCLPRALGDVCEVLGLAEQKDKMGYAVMMRCCKPKANGEWNEDPQDLLKLFQYCIQDVEAEACLSEKLRDLTPKELLVWQLDQKMNRRGIPLDREACTAMINVVREHSLKLLTEFKTLTGGRITTPGQRDKLLDLLDRQEGVNLDDLTKATVKGALDSELSPTARRLLEIRSSLSKASTAKYAAALRCCSADGRVRSTLMYHGAGPGRWTGKGVQVQNFIRDCQNAAGTAFEAAALGSDFVEQLYGDPMVLASKCLRGIFISSPKKSLAVADYSSIEGRVNAWQAGEGWVLDAYERGEDLYCINASRIYGRSISKADKQERQIGKIAELALGYQGAVGAFSKMAEAYGVNMAEDEVINIVKTWRESRPAIVQMWYQLEQTALDCMAKPGAVIPVGKVSMMYKHPWFMVKLPSGRILYYAQPEVHRKPVKNGEKLKEHFCFHGVEPTTRKWCIQSMYGGKWCENIVQAIARDIMAEAMLRAEGRGYEMLFTVHDELVAEKEDASLDEFIALVEEPPSWASGCPIKAEGFVGTRYGKG